MSAQSKLHQPMTEKANNLYFSVKEFINKLALATGEAARRYATKEFSITGVPTVFSPLTPQVDTRFFIYTSY